MTKFIMGQDVIATEAVQGLVEGVVYKVMEVIEYPTAFGTFVTYYLNDPFHPDRAHHAIHNGHLILKAL